MGHASRDPRLMTGDLGMAFGMQQEADQEIEAQFDVFGGAPLKGRP